MGPILEGFGLFGYKIKPEQEFTRLSISFYISYGFRTLTKSFIEIPTTVEEGALQMASYHRLPTAMQNKLHAFQFVADHLSSQAAFMPIISGR